MRLVALTAAIAGLPLLAIAGHSFVHRHQAHPAPTVNYSRDALMRARDSLTAQIAALDQAEQAMRAPTPAEAAALAAPPVASRIVRLPQGGVALGLDASQLSWAVATIGDDGAVHVTDHGAPIDAVEHERRGGRDAQ